MAAAKIRVSDIAKRMGKSEKDVMFQLQSLGADVTDANQVLEPEVIQALITGKKLTTRSRSVIMREDKPVAEKSKKEAVRPPRPIVKPATRTKAAPPTEEPAPAPAAPTVIIPEFIQAAEDEERAAKEAPAPAVPEQPKVAAELSVAPPSPAAVAAEDRGATPKPKPAAPRAAERQIGASGPRARAPQSPRPNYAGQAPAVRPSSFGAGRPATGAARPAMGARPGTATRPGAPGARPSGP